MATGKVFIIAAPSGAGKTSLLKKVLDELDHVNVSVSHTTRSPREGEKYGKDYHFVHPEEFEQMLERGDFLEHAKVFGHLYGTSRIEVEKMLAHNESVALEIDWQGARQVRRIMPGVFSIFILPPSMAVLRKRLDKRGKDSPETIAHRLDMAQEEIRHHDEFDAILINDEFDIACAELKRLLSGEPSVPAQEALAKRALYALLAPADPDAV